MGRSKIGDCYPPGPVGAGFPVPSELSQSFSRPVVPASLHYWCGSPCGPWQRARTVSSIGRRTSPRGPAFCESSNGSRPTPGLGRFGRRMALGRSDAARWRRRQPRADEPVQADPFLRGLDHEFTVRFGRNAHDELSAVGAPCQRRWNRFPVRPQIREYLLNKLADPSERPFASRSQPAERRELEAAPDILAVFWRPGHSICVVVITHRSPPASRWLAELAGPGTSLPCLDRSVCSHGDLLAKACDKPDGYRLRVSVRRSRRHRLWRGRRTVRLWGCCGGPQRSSQHLPHE